MTDYKVAKQVRKFGTDRPATPVIDEVPFVIQTDGQNKFVNIGIVAGAHGSHVAGIAAGNALFGGQMSGAAPGAKIVSSRACLWLAGCFAHALNEGMIEVAKQENVDVINMSIGGLPALNDGNNTRCVLYGRLIETYNVQMFISMGNDGPGINTAGDPGLCDKVMGVGAYITDDTYLSAYGAQLYEQDNLHYFSSRGPREDGGFDPEIVAPGAAISTIPMWQAQGCLAQTCPVGYALFNGTSMAAPQSTGAGALLVSAAQQFGAQHQPDQIRKALLSSSRYLTGRYQAYEQGVGLIDVGAAWDLLKTNLKSDDISSSVPVNTLLSPFLATPGVGKGIYDREGVTAGDSYTRTYTFTRNDGPGGTTTYDLSWLGQRRDVQLGWFDRAAEGLARHVRRDRQPRDFGRPFGDPAAGRPDLGGHRVPDAEHGDRRGSVHGCGELLRDEVRVARAGAVQDVLLQRAGGRARLQGGHDRWRASRRRGYPVPALASVGPRDRLERGVQLLQRRAGRLPYG